MATNIYYTDARTAVENFMDTEFPSCPKKFKKRFLSYFGKFLNYEEEGERFFPKILLTNNINAIDKDVEQSTKIELFTKENELSFESDIKSIMPFNSTDWWIYICITKPKDDEKDDDKKEEKETKKKDDKKDDEEDNFCIEYGVITTMKSRKDNNFRENVLSAPKLLNKAKKTDLILLEKTSEYVINLQSIKGNSINVNFSFDSGNQYLDNIDEDEKDRDIDIIVHEFADAIFAKCTKKAKLPEVKEKFCHIFKSIIKKVHGTICVVADKDYTEKGLLRDGKWLSKPINLFNALDVKDNKDTDEIRLINMADLLATMLNLDGITVIDNAGRIIAYNVYVSSNVEKTGIVGGARKRAALTIKKSPKGSKHLTHVYFQSQEGEIKFYKIEKKEEKVTKTTKTKTKKEETSKNGDNK